VVNALDKAEYALQSLSDIEDDEAVGFELIKGDDIDDLGIPEIVRRIRRRVGDTPVYLR
jgi:agmatinase